MSKLIFERRKENQSNANKNLQNKISQDRDSSSFIDKSNISESDFNIKEEYNTNMKSIEEYKKEIDRIFESKKSKLDSAFELESEENEENMEEKYEENGRSFTISAPNRNAGMYMASIVQLKNAPAAE